MKLDYREWPQWAIREAQALSKRTDLWKDEFTDPHDQALANEGQFHQLGYPFDMITLAKMKCDAAGDNPHLFMKHFTQATLKLTD
jgi:hypothetical protein